MPRPAPPSLSHTHFSRCSRATAVLGPPVPPYHQSKPAGSGISPSPLPPDRSRKLSTSRWPESSRSRKYNATN